MNNIFNLIDEMETYFDSCKKMPVTNKLMVDVEVIYEFMTDLRVKLPEEIKRSERIVNEKEKIIYDAKHAAQSVEKEAESKVSELINDHEIKKHAEVVAEKIVADANATASEIKMGAYEYVDELIEQLQVAVTDTLQQTSSHYTRFEGYMNKQLEALDVNRSELIQRKNGNI